MPVHDWTRVGAGTFHAFHHYWIGELARALKRVLPPGYYALAEQSAGAITADVLTLQRPAPEPTKGTGGVATLPRASFTQTLDVRHVKPTRKHVTIRHVSGHRLVAVIEVVSPGNKSGDEAMKGFRDKVVMILQDGIHVLILDLFPPGASDPSGVPGLISEACQQDPLPIPPGRDRLMASYRAKPPENVFIEPVGVGEALPDMPLYLTDDRYVNVPLEPAYARAIEVVPDFVIEELNG